MYSFSELLKLNSNTTQLSLFIYTQHYF